MMERGVIVTMFASAVLMVAEMEGSHVGSGTGTDVQEAGRQKRATISESAWSRWFNQDNPLLSEGDFETTDSIQKTQRICKQDDQAVVDAQCRIQGSNETFDSTNLAGITDHLMQACTNHGLICLNSQQPSGRCQDYEVRFLCRDMSSESGGKGDSIFPNFDFKIYIVLAIVPILVVSLRVIWSCCCKNRFKGRREQQGQGRQQRPSLDSLSSSCSSQGSIDSALANPPPTYSELFGNAQPGIFAISRGNYVACEKCSNYSHMAGFSPEEVNALSDTHVVSVEDLADVSSPSEAAVDSDEVFEPLSSSSVDTEIAMGSPDSVMIDQTLNRVPEASQSVTSDSPVTRTVEVPTADSTSSTSSTLCPCACHKFQQGQLNLAFHWESSDQLTMTLPAVYPGMHKPVFSVPRVDSLSSMTSFTEPPDYEQALEILKKSKPDLREAPT